MNGHIVIEGVDKTGKSTLARFLSEKTGMPIKKFSAPADGADPTLAYIEFLVSGEPSIIDRCWLSEMAYGPVMRGKSWIGPNQQRIVEKVAELRGVGAVYCTDTVGNIAERFEADGEDFLPSVSIPSVLEGFKNAMATSILPWRTYRIGDNMEELYDKLR